MTAHVETPPVVSTARTLALIAVLAVLSALVILGTASAMAPAAPSTDLPAVAVVVDQEPRTVDLDDALGVDWSAEHGERVERTGAGTALYGDEDQAAGHCGDYCGTDAGLITGPATWDGAPTA